MNGAGVWISIWVQISSLILANPLIPDLGTPEDSTYLGFCQNDNYVMFTANACPGGVRLLNSSLKITNEDGSKACICLNGHFLGANFGAYAHDNNAPFMMGEYGKDKTCFEPAIESDSSEIDIWTIFPQNGKNILTDTMGGSLFNRRNDSKDVERWERLKENNQKCTLPTTCQSTPDSFVRVPPSPISTHSDSAQLLSSMSPKEIHAALLDESLHLLEYRFRITGQKAKIRKLPDYPAALGVIDVAIRIFQKLSKNILSSEIVLLAYDLFEYMYHDQYIGNGQLTSRDYEGIKHGLEKCESFLQPLPSSLFTCPSPTSKEKAEHKTSKSKRSTISEDRLYNTEKNDPIVELIWKAIDTTHTACFSYFSFNPSLHHLYGIEMMNFFSLEPLQIRWMRSISKTQRKSYNVILPGLNEDLLKAADNVLQVITTSSTTDQYNAYHNPLRKPTHIQVPAENQESDIADKACPDNRLIWGGSACCLDYNEEDGIVPKLESFCPGGPDCSIAD